MTNTTTTPTKEQIDYAFDSFTNYLIPFGSMDIRMAVETALEVGENGEWAAEQVQEFADSCGMKIDDCDPCYCVYDAILQEARTEIDGLIDFDFLNDGAEIDTHGNFMCTQYDYKSEAPETIKQKLIEAEIVFEDLSEKTQWFLSQIEANY
jgi:hypothetical protein